MITQSEYLESLSLPFCIPAKGSTFPKLMEEFAYMTEAFTRKKIKEYLEYIDARFRMSEDRKKRFYVKEYKERTIITMYGEITYYRTIYWDRIKRRRYIYLDRRLGIDKWIRYTNDVASYVAEAYADENSMIKVGNEIGNLIHCKFSLKDNRIYCVPRQTIYNLLKRTKEIRIHPTQENRDVQELYLLFDEKYLPSHRKEGKRSHKMVKSALIVEGLNKENPNRHQYIHPHYYSSLSKDFADEILDEIGERYNIDSLKSIHVLADGAKWIKAVSQDIRLPNTKHTNYLDHFHYTQSLWRIFRDKELYKIANSYIIHNNKDQFIQLTQKIRDERGEDSQINYIIHNWDLIQNTVHLKDMNCAMEQCISHHIHSQFANVPKVYSIDNLNRYLSLRDNYRNHENIKELFLEALDDKSDSDKTILHQPSFDYSFFDKQIPLPYYTASLKSGKKPIRFTPHPDYRFTD